VSEYFRSLLRDAQQEEEDARLETLLLEGFAGGRDIPIASNAAPRSKYSRYAQHSPPLVWKTDAPS